MTNKYDVAICGGGLVGLTLGLALARYGVETAIIRSPPSIVIYVAVPPLPSSEAKIISPSSVLFVNVTSPVSLKK